MNHLNAGQMMGIRWLFSDSHFSTHPRDISCQWRVIEAPVLKVIAIPLLDGKMDSQLHPMPLCFIITKHGRCAVS